jgi:hypothetical protein
MPHQLPREPAAVPAIGRRAAEAPEAAARALADAGHEAMYEAVVDRLRRDLLAERERMGDLLGEWP